jgi:ATP-dependent Lon protease
MIAIKKKKISPSIHQQLPIIDTTKIEQKLKQLKKEQKKKVLNNLKIKGYCEQKNVQKDALIFCLIGPPGVGKTSFARLLAQSLKKEFFLVPLGGISDNSLLSGANESSSGTEIGQLTKALIETRTCDPVILLDEIDKVSFYKGNSTIHSYLNTVLDPEQNKEISDYYLDVKLDFSRVTFIITVNDQDKIPEYLLSKTPVIVKLPGYNIEEKKKIASKFIQRLFDQNISINQNNFEITSEAIETLINKTKERGVRQLKSSIDNIFDYCLLQ